MVESGCSPGFKVLPLRQGCPSLKFCVAKSIQVGQRLHVVEFISKSVDHSTGCKTYGLSKKDECAPGLGSESGNYCVHVPSSFRAGVSYMRKLCLMVRVNGVL